MAESDSRKELLARALLEYLELHPNEPVSVTSITRICGISRQSFYYHFRDIHDLHAWTLHHELMKTVRPVRGEGWRLPQTYCDSCALLMPVIRDMPDNVKIPL